MELHYATKDEGRSGPSGSSWIQIGPNTVACGFRYLEIMQQMNWKNYNSSNPARLVSRMQMPRRSYFYLPGDGFEVVLGVRQHHRRKRRFQVMSCGFIGDIAPQAALDIVIDQLTVIGKSVGTHRFFAIRPYFMDSKELMNLYQLAEKSSALELRQGRADVSGTLYWITIRRLRENKTEVCD